MPPKKRGRSAGGGSKGADDKTVEKLSHTLGITEEEVKKMIDSKGAEGPPNTSRRGRSDAAKEEKKEEDSGVAASSAWADFMDDEGAEEGVKLESKGGDDLVSKNNKYLKVSSDAQDAKDEKREGILVQTGTLDWDTVGRTKKSAAEVGELDIAAPTILTRSIFGKVKVRLIAASCTACHSFAVDTNGLLYGWGRNEAGQLGNGETATVTSPVLVETEGKNWNKRKIVSVAVGKSHSVVVDDLGEGWASGKNDTGQLGVGSQTDANCLAWKQQKFQDNKASVLKKVACGENFTVVLDEEGILFTTGLSEFGQLGNGETGEYFVTASKLAFSNESKLTPRRTFVRRDLNFREGDEPEILADSSDIRIGSIACGKNHTVAVECQRAKNAPVRVFTWGSGNYGCLGHKVQKDEYLPRHVETIKGPMFTSNQPVHCSAGSTCTMIRTSQGHVYYWGKHRTVGEAQMYPLILDFLANNGHEAKAYDAGNSHVVISTTEAVTVSYGQGPYGELGFGPEGAKSSSQPSFIDTLDKVKIAEIACGYGHTLLLAESASEVEGMDEFDGERVVKAGKERAGKKTKAA
ncbi:hypothetical protein TrST_g5640 [Triparma strigata]|uniref:Uncharacterized protein n=1 Tax=Triparma strigata TaxID=1606541 RepID=A0A9W6ZZT2_9STRA|nr:hypothetical protein TrST_g5640 [Triparma strigata]